MNDKRKRAFCQVEQQPDKLLSPLRLSRVCVTFLHECGKMLAEGCRGSIDRAQHPAKRPCVPGRETILNQLQCHRISLKASTHSRWAQASSGASLAAGRHDGL
jgi:hypothetical protein